MWEKADLTGWSIILLLYGSYTSVTYYLFNTVYDAQPTPFIDEVFHIPQAKKYCNGTFDEWDPKITTLPGVYLLSVGVIKPLSYLFDVNLCTSYVLRMTNVVANTVNLCLFYLLLKRMYRVQVNFNEMKVLLSALNMAIFPPLYFFSFLYYTEPVSTMLVLLTILLHLHDYFIISSFIGLISVIARQTNIVWVALLGLDGVIYVLNYYARIQGNRGIIRVQSSPKYVNAILRIVYESEDKLTLFLSILRVVIGYALVIASFLIFIVVNKGIVIGDKQSHEAGINIPQLFYLAWFYLFFTAPFSVFQLNPFYKFARRNWKLLVFVSILCGVIIYFNTLVHPYLLADNRHYTFYLWNKMYGKYEVIRYILIPVNLFGLYCIYNNMNHLNFVNQIGFFVCTAICLVPQRLLDVRYFILPYLLLRLQIKSTHWWQIFVELIFYILINILTVYLFVTKTFYWSDIREPQRIIW